MVKNLMLDLMSVRRGGAVDRSRSQKSQKSLYQLQHEARLALGRRMWTSGIDDGTIGVQIAALDAQTREKALPPVTFAAIEAARTALFLRLADLALEDDAPLPGAEAEFRRARESIARTSPFHAPCSF
jgi:hypothetical protein